MADTGLMLPSLEDVITRRLRGNQPRSLLDDPEIKKAEEIHNLFIYNEQLNKDQPIPPEEPGILQRGINTISNAASSALAAGERIAAPIVELQKRTGQRERDALQLTADAVLPTVSGIASTVGGGILGVSEYLNRVGADVARRGPLPQEAGTTRLPIEPSKVLPSGEYVPATDFRNVQKVQQEYTYQPRTEIGKVFNDVLQFPIHLITKGADLVEDAAVAVGVPQQSARAIATAVEIAGFYFGDKAFRRGARSVGAKVKEFKTNLDANNLDAALKNSQELFDKVDNDIISGRLTAARQRQQTAQNDLINTLRQRGATLEAEQLAAEAAETARRTTERQAEIAARRAAIPTGPTVTGNLRGTTRTPTGELTGTLPSRIPTEIVTPETPVGGGTPFPTEAIADFLRRAEPEVSARVTPEATAAPAPLDLYTAFETATSAEATAAAQRNALVYIKGKALETVPGNLEEGLVRLGFGEPDIAEMLPWLKNTRLPRNIPPTEPPAPLPAQVPQRPVAPTEISVNEIIAYALDILVDKSVPKSVRNTALRTIKTEALKTAPGKLEQGLRNLGFNETNVAELLPELKNVRVISPAPAPSTVQNLVSEGSRVGSTIDVPVELVTQPIEIPQTNPIRGMESTPVGPSGGAISTDIPGVEAKRPVAPSEISVDIPPAEPSPIVQPTRTPTRKIIPTELTPEQRAVVAEALDVLSDPDAPAALRREARKDIEGLEERFGVKFAEFPDVTSEQVAIVNNPRRPRRTPAAETQRAIEQAVDPYLPEQDRARIRRETTEYLKSAQHPGNTIAEKLKSAAPGLSDETIQLFVEGKLKSKILPDEHAITPYQEYTARNTTRSGAPAADLVVGEVLRSKGVTLTEDQFIRMQGELNNVPKTPDALMEYTNNYLQRRGAEAQNTVTREQALNQPQSNYVQVTSLNNLPSADVPGGALSKTAPVQILREGGKPTSILINNNALHTRSLAHIEAEAARMERSNIPPEARLRINLDRAKIQAKADLLGISVEEAGQISTTDLYSRIAKVALDNDLTLYKLTRNGMEEVPRNIVETTAKLNDGALAEPKKISVEDRAQYMAEQARETSPLTFDQILNSLTEGVDISGELPPELGKLYSRALKYNMNELTKADRRSVGQILKSINNLLGEKGAIGNIELTALQKSAFNELRNDAIRMGKDIMKLIRGDPRLNTIEKTLFEEYARSTKAPPPKPYMTLNDMSFDSEAALRGDFVIKRAEGEVTGTYRPEIYYGDWFNLAVGDDIPAKSSVSRPESMQTAARKLLNAGQEDIVHAYRGVERNLSKDRADYMQTIQKMKRQFTEEQQRAIGADMFLDEGSIDLLIASNIEPRALTAAETAGKQFIRSVFEELFPRAQDVRKNTGRAPMDYVPDYITHMRAMNLDDSGKVGTKISMDAADVISERYANLKNTPFPFEKTRRGGKFPAEMNAFKILETYTDYALRQIHVGPFVAKIHELIDTPIIDPSTNKTWNMKTEKPILYEYMKDWNNYIAGQPQYKIPKPWNEFLFATSRSLGNAYIAGNLFSAIIQPTSLFNTYMKVGMPTLTKATINYLKDAVTPGHPRRKFRLENSELLDTRNADIFFDEAGQGLLEYAMEHAKVRGRTPLAPAGRAMSQISKTIGDIGTKPLRFLDQVAADISWDAGYEFALQFGKEGKAAFNVADDIVTLTQGSALRGERSPIQRSQAGRALTQFQTFAINNYDFLTKEILGIDNKSMTPQQRVRNIMKLIGAGTLLNVLIEDVGGGNSPVPNPPLAAVRTLLRGREDNQTNVQYLAELVFGSTVGELLKVAPVLSSVRNPRGQVGGPIVSYGVDLTRAALGQERTSLGRTAVRGLVPGGLQIDKALLTPEKKNTNSFKTLSGENEMLRGLRD